jgi:hypothetical protein
MTDEKKEKVLHTRIPGSLDEEIKDQASQLGVSVSNLVRNILQNAFGLVEGIVADSSNIASAARSTAPAPRPPPRPEAEAPPPPREPQILGWQEAVLNLNGVCDLCNAILPRGSRAAIALYDVPGPRAFRCLTCLEEEIHDPDRRGQEPDAD